MIFSAYICLQHSPNTAKLRHKHHTLTHKRSESIISLMLVCIQDLGGTSLSIRGHTQLIQVLMRAITLHYYRDSTRGRGAGGGVRVLLRCRGDDG